MISERAQRLINAAQNRVVGRENPKLADLPSWVEGFRPGQIEAVKKIMAAFEDEDVVVLDAPTGTGKTLIAETVRRLMGTRALYVCNSKHLQDQFQGDFDYAVTLKGRSNYEPIMSVDGATCADCGGEKCVYCPSKGECPYEIAKSRALVSPLAVLNTAYYLTECNGPGKFSGRGLVVMDEADTLEQELMRYVEVTISKGRCARYGLSEPAKVTVAASWREWIERAIPTLTRRRSSLRGEGLAISRERGYLERTISALRRIAPDIEDGWVYTGKDGAVSFKPVRVDKVGRDSLWKHGRKFLLMSATIVSAGSLIENLGGGGFTAVTMPSTWSVENRRVRVIPAANMSRKKDSNGDESQALVRALLPILVRHRRERVLLHCVSYQLARYLHGELSGRCGALGMGCSTYSGSDGKADALAGFRDGEGHLLIAPSMDRGVDLPDDQCRVIVIAKVPYPYLGDRQVSARLYSKGGQVWYNVQTVRSIVQMTGRGVRHSEDWCVGYILDSQFRELWGRARGLFPKWWVDGLEWT